MNYLIDRLAERSTWLGLIGLATGLGVGIDQELAETIIAVGASIAGLVAMLTKD